jgi:hypothetical protein
VGLLQGGLELQRESPKMQLRECYMNNYYYILAIFIEFKAVMLLTVLQLLYSAVGFFRSLQPVHILCLTFCVGVKQDLLEKILQASVIL